MTLTKYFVEATDDTPKVTLDPQSGHFEIVGNSYPENSSKFYQPILEWLLRYVNDAPKQPMVFEFNFDYFNTSSAKYILEVLRVVEQYQSMGNECLIKWYYFQDDTDMLEAGEDYQATMSVPFELIERLDTF